jgi:hypothetical protein
MYKSYIQLVWQQVSRPNDRLSKEALQGLEAFLNNVFVKVATEAMHRLARYRHNRTLSPLIIERTVMTLLDAPLAQLAAAATKRMTPIEGLPGSRMHTYLKRGNFAGRVSPKAGAAIAAVLDVILRKVLLASQQCMVRSGMKTLKVAHILEGVTTDMVLQSLRVLICATPYRPARPPYRPRRNPTKKKVSFGSQLQSTVLPPLSPSPPLPPLSPLSPLSPLPPSPPSPPLWPMPPPTPAFTASSASKVVVDAVEKLVFLLSVNEKKLEQYLFANFNHKTFAKAFHPDRCIAGAAAVTSLFQGIGINIELSLGGPVACEQVFSKFSSIFAKSGASSQPIVMGPAPVSQPLPMIKNEPEFAAAAADDDAMFKTASAYDDAMFKTAQFDLPDTDSNSDAGFVEAAAAPKGVGGFFANLFGGGEGQKQRDEREDRNDEVIDFMNYGF